MLAPLISATSFAMAEFLARKLPVFRLPIACFSTRSFSRTSCCESEYISRIFTTLLRNRGEDFSHANNAIIIRFDSENVRIWYNL